MLAGTGDVDLVRALEALGTRGYASVLAEGGPSLNAQLAGAGLLDELCLTLAPTLVGGPAKRILDGSGPARPRGMTLRSLCEADGFLFLRFTSGGREAAR